MSSRSRGRGSGDGGGESQEVDNMCGVKDEDGLEILPSDHPLMRRFQESLRLQLKQLNDALAEEVLVLDAERREQEEARQSVGERVYDAQQQVERQLSLLDACHTSLSSAMEVRERAEELVSACRTTHRAHVDKHARAQSTEYELRSQLEGLVELVNQLSQWQQQVQSELSVSQLITDKAAKDKLLLANEKRKQDVLLLKLAGELLRLEQLRQQLDSQLTVRQEECAQLAQLVADSNADLHALQQEHRELLQAWGCVVAALRHRDHASQSVAQQLRKLQAELSSVECEIEGYRKCMEAEMVQNEKLTLILQRHQLEGQELQRRLDAEINKKSLSEAQLSSFSDVLSATEESLQVSLSEQKQLMKEDRLLELEVEKLLSEKVHLEDDMLDRLEQQSSHDKTAQHINRLVVQLREATRAQERALVRAENEVSQLCLSVERQRTVNKHTRQLVCDLKAEVSTQEQALNTLHKELSASQSAITNKQSSIHLLGLKLEEFTARHAAEDKSPSELKIAEITQNIADTADNIDKLQHQWLRLQGRILQLSQKTTEQFHAIDILRKQVVVKEHGNQRLEQEVSSVEQQDHELRRSINMLLNKLERLSTLLFQHRDHKNNLNKDNTFTSSHYLTYLKECERAHVQLQADVEDVREEKLQLSQQLVELQREGLAWQKKLQLAIETRRNISREQSSSGDVGTMKSEIHRMEVRQSQLRKVQERLAHDLEQCVSRRSAITTAARVREKRAAVPSLTTCHQRPDDVRSKLRHTLSELGSVEREVAGLEARQQELLQQLTDEQELLQQLQLQATNLEQQLQETCLAKHKKLEVLVKNQRKLKMLEEVKQGRYKLLFRNDAALNAEHQRQLTTHAHLVSTVHSLLADFPTLAVQFTHVLNYLQLSPP